MQEVGGSIPPGSTKFAQHKPRRADPFSASPSSRGLGHHPFTVDTGVRIPVGTPLCNTARESGPFLFQKHFPTTVAHPTWCQAASGSVAATGGDRRPPPAHEHVPGKVAAVPGRAGAWRGNAGARRIEDADRGLSRSPAATSPIDFRTKENARLRGRFLQMASPRGFEPRCPP